MIQAIEQNDREHIIEEIADVLNVINQFIVYYAIKKDYKIKRTLKRIKENWKRDNDFRESTEGEEIVLTPF